MAGSLLRAFRSPRVLLALVMVLGLGVCAIFAGFIAPHDPNEQNLLSIRIFCSAPTASAAMCCRG
jgi:ABC-type antimicrobial peptide transport system permease subunit